MEISISLIISALGTVLSFILSYILKNINERITRESTNSLGRIEKLDDQTNIKLDKQTLHTRDSLIEMRDNINSEAESVTRRISENESRLKSEMDRRIVNIEALHKKVEEQQAEDVKVHLDLVSRISKIEGSADVIRSIFEQRGMPAKK